MIDMKRYFSFLFGKRANIAFSIFALSLILILSLSFPLGASSGKWESVSGGYKYIYGFFETACYVSSFVLLGLCFIEPALMFSFKMKRNSFEAERRLAVSKKSMYFARYILGYLEIIIPFTFSYFISMGIIFASQGLISFHLTLLLYSILLIGGALAYSFFLFFYLRARNSIDGFLLMILATLALIFLGNAIMYLIIRFNGNIITLEYRLNPFSIFQCGCILVSDLFNHKNTLDFSTIIFALVMVFICSLAILGIVFHKGDFNVEHANQKTVSYFGYKTLIPLTFIPLVVFKNVIGLPIYYIFLVLVFALTYLAYALSYRRFLFNKKGWILYFIVIGVELILYFITLFI